MKYEFKLSGFFFIVYDCFGGNFVWMNRDVIEHIAAVDIAVVGIVIVGITVVVMMIHEIKTDEMIGRHHVYFDHLHFCPSINSRLGVTQESFF